jgi:hypothetical protein
MDRLKQPNNEEKGSSSINIFSTFANKQMNSNTYSTTSCIQQNNLNLNYKAAENGSSGMN